MSCKQILIVEDDEDIRNQVAQALTVEGYEVIKAENGQVALDILLALPEEKIPRCMILDLMMPVMDGIKLLEIIERDYKDRFGGIKVLIATAKGSPISPVSVPGAVERMQKPFDLDELYNLVEIHCGKP